MVEVGGGKNASDRRSSYRVIITSVIGISHLLPDIIGMAASEKDPQGREVEGLNSIRLCAGAANNDLQIRLISSFRLWQTVIVVE